VQQKHLHEGMQTNIAISGRTPHKACTVARTCARPDCVSICLTLQGSNSLNRPSGVDRLSQEQLAQVLQHVPLKERLSSCALVHSSWRAAVAEATTTIECSYENKSLSAWLSSHCNTVHVRRMSISTPSWPDYPLRLPVINLQYLQKLTVVGAPWEPATASSSGRQPLKSGTRQGALPSLANLTALTSLDLAGASVRLDGLEALTGLKELSLSCRVSGRGFGRTVPTFDTAEALLAEALPKLQHLTRLCLQGKIGSSTVVAQVSTMQSLEQLLLAETTVASFPPMPQSVTRLCVRCERAQEVFTNSTQQFSQLTGLQDLTLSGAGALDTTLLAGMGRLQHVNLSADTFAAADTQPLLVFSRLTALESLKLIYRGSLWVTPAAPTPAEAAALTTSSHLTNLDVISLTDALQQAHYEAMFPAGRQLQRLRELRSGTALLSGTIDVGQLTGLTSFSLRMLGLRDELQLAAGLKALTALNDLAELQLSAVYADFPAVVWSSLAALTGLKHLKMWCSAPSGQHLLLFTSCQRLRSLHIHATCDDYIYAAKFAPGVPDAGIELEVGICCPEDTTSAMCCAEKTTSVSMRHRANVTVSTSTVTDR